MKLFIILSITFILLILCIFKFKSFFNKSPIGGFFLIPSFLLYVYLCYNNIFISFLLLTLFLFILGVLDDFYNLKVITRFSTVFILIFIFLLSNKDLIKISSFDNDSLFFILFFTFLVMGFIHTMNMIDGIDGLYISYVIIAFILITFFEIESIYFLISLIFLLILNLQKKIIIGNSGNLYISAIIPIIFIFNVNTNIEIFGYSLEINKELLTILFIIPLIDGLRVTVQRILNSSSPFRKDLSHIQFINYNEKLCLVLILLTQVLINILYLILNNFMFTIIFSIIFYVTLIAILRKVK